MKGNSGARLENTITKFGPDAMIEGAFCQFLGEKVCPKIYSTSPGHYTMEKLEPIARTSNLLRDIEKLLENEVWCRPSQNYEVTGEMNYLEFHKSMGVKTPEWAIPKEYCLIHGDPTVSNTMLRGKELILIDPRAPNGHIPSCKMVDMGKILQSWFGWEIAAYSEPKIQYAPPYFTYDKELFRQAKFWCYYHVARIEQLEIKRGLNRENILDWCYIIKGMCGSYEL